jgi:hypothetical protein
MTTLVLPESRSNASVGSSSTVPLREWLAGHWAILFSHPDDFDQEQLERDRWLTLVSRSFSTHGLRAMALDRFGYDARGTSHGWLAELGGGCAAVLSTAPPVEGALLDFRASTLRAEIARSGPRFAMIIDSDLRCQRTMHYRAAVDLPSPIELAGWAVALRERHGRVSYPDARDQPTPAYTLDDARTAVGRRGSGGHYGGSFRACGRS